MGNPYAPVSARRTTRPQVLTELEQFVVRIKRHGATDDDVADVQAHWDDFDEEWTPEYRARLVRASDDEFVAMLAERNEEFKHDTTTDDQAAAEAVEKAQAVADAEAFQLIGGNVRSIIDWVGESFPRAMAVNNLERGPDGAGRKSLLAYVDGVLGGTPT